jgi:hypothetical protein
MPIVADYYTRLYKPQAVSARNQPLFDALNHLADVMRLHWNKDTQGGWLQFRSTSFYNDRLREVPNRLLSRWAAARRRHGMLPLDDLMEIIQLPDAQLLAPEMTEGAQLCFGLSEWSLLHNPYRYPHWRFLAELTPTQREEAMNSPNGLLLTHMSLAQQRTFIAHVLGEHAAGMQSLDELAGATLRVEYTQPGWFQWGNPDSSDWQNWVILLEPGPLGRRALRPAVRERTREAALQAARRIDPHADPSEIFPTRLGLKMVYMPGSSNKREIWIVGANWMANRSTW